MDGLPIAVCGVASRPVRACPINASNAAEAVWCEGLGGVLVFRVVVSSGVEWCRELWCWARSLASCLPDQFSEYRQELAQLYCRPPLTNTIRESCNGDCAEIE